MVILCCSADTVSKVCVYILSLVNTQRTAEAVCVCVSVNNSKQCIVYLEARI